MTMVVRASWAQRAVRGRPAEGPETGPPAADSDRRLVTTATVATAFAGFAVVLYLVDAMLALSDSTAILLLSIMIATMAVAALGVTAMVTRAGSWGLGSVRIGAWYLAWTGVAFGLASVTWRGPQQGLSAMIESRSVVVALGLVALALLCWLGGYLAGVPRRLSCLGDAIARLAAPGPAAGFAVRSPVVPWALAGLSVAARVSQISAGNYGYLGDPRNIATSSTAWSQTVSLAGNCGSLAVVVATIDLVRRPSMSRRATLAVLLSVELGFGLLSGMKEGFLTALLGPVVVLAVAGRFPLRWVVAGALLFLVVVMPYNTAYRQTVRTQSQIVDPGNGAGVAASVLRTTVSGGNVGHGLTESASRLSRRVREVGALAVVVQETPGMIAYRSPKELLAGPVIGFIPRAVWPGKPVLNSGYLFDQEYWGHGDDVYSSAAITPQADLYRHGGIPVLVIGMVILGMAMRLIDDKLHPGRDLRLAVLYVPLLPLLVKSESDVIGLVASLPPVVLLAVLVSRVSFASAPGGNRV